MDIGTSERTEKLEEGLKENVKKILGEVIKSKEITFSNVTFEEYLKSLDQKL
jgi:hypothetical protein